MSTTHIQGRPGARRLTPYERAAEHLARGGQSDNDRFAAAARRRLGVSSVTGRAELLEKLDEALERDPREAQALSDDALYAKAFPDEQKPAASAPVTSEDRLYERMFGGR